MRIKRAGGGATFSIVGFKFHPPCRSEDVNGPIFLLSAPLHWSARERDLQEFKAEGSDWGPRVQI